MGSVAANATLGFTWLIMVLLVGGSWLITRRISTTTHLSRWQHLLEVLVSGLQKHIQEVSQQEAEPYLAFVGTLFVFILMTNVLSPVPGYLPPTSSFSTTMALALCVFIAVPFYGIRQQGWKAYLANYLQPTALMLPFNILGEIARTLALAVRLYGNIMSGTVIAAILLSIAPLFFPILLQALGLLTGVIQAYIFAVLAMVFIASATQAHHHSGNTPQPSEQGER
jgi:F-type H+-transporting ATPase subunit a